MDNLRSAIKKKNEIVNTITHFIGFLLSILALVLMLLKTNENSTKMTIVSIIIFGGSLIILYAASSIYHYASRLRLKYYLNKVDHSAIYVLIAGTYTPYALISLADGWGWSIFCVIWALALAGIVFKIFWYKQKYKAISAIAYVVMGLVILIALNPLIEAVRFEGFMWLVGGGVSYIAGVFFYLNKKIPYSHGIFHLFVLAGSYCHFYSIYQFVLP